MLTRRFLTLISVLNSAWASRIASSVGDPNPVTGAVKCGMFTVCEHTNELSYSRHFSSLTKHRYLHTKIADEIATVLCYSSTGTSLLRFILHKLMLIEEIYEECVDVENGSRVVRCASNRNNEVKRTKIRTWRVYVNKSDTKYSRTRRF